MGKLKAEFHEDKKVRKRLSSPASSLQQSGNYWFAGRVEMQDLSSGLRTTLRVKSVTPDPEPALSSGTFDPKTFYQR